MWAGNYSKKRKKKRVTSFSSLLFIYLTLNSNGTSLIHETIGCTVFNVEITIAAFKLSEYFIDAFLDNVHKMMIVQKGYRTFRFGNYNKLSSLKRVTLSSIIGSIRLDIVQDDIPLLLGSNISHKMGWCCWS